MKTLKMIPITKKPTNMLAHADNGVYEVIIRYWGDDDVNDIHLENATADDINIFIDMKMPKSLFPQIDIVFSDTIDEGPTRMFLLKFEGIWVAPDDFDNFIKIAQFGKDTLDDIKEILTDLVPHLMTEEQFKESADNLQKSAEESRKVFDNMNKD